MDLEWYKSATDKQKKEINELLTEKQKEVETTPESVTEEKTEEKEEPKEKGLFRDKILRDKENKNTVDSNMINVCDECGKKVENCVCKGTD